MGTHGTGIKYFTHAVQELFLNQLVESGGNIGKALNGIPITRYQLTKYAKEHSAFNTRFNDALDLGLDALEDEAKRRGFDGVEEAVYHKAKKIGVKRNYSDTLLKFILAGRRKKIYGKETRLKLEGGDSPIDLNSLPDSIKEKLAEIQNRKAEAEDE